MGNVGINKVKTLHHMGNFDIMKISPFFHGQSWHQIGNKMNTQKSH